MPPPYPPHTYGVEAAAGSGCFLGLMWAAMLLLDEDFNTARRPRPFLIAEALLDGLNETGMMAGEDRGGKYIAEASFYFREERRSARGLSIAVLVPNGNT